MFKTSGKQADAVTVEGARIIAYRFLSIREHSCDELTGKLLKRGVPERVASQTVAALNSEGLMDDLRFAKSFTRSRISRTQGPLKIRAELIKRGIEAELIEQALTEHDEQWLELALCWARKRAGPDLNRNEKARLYRSGTARGFTHGQMMKAIGLLESNE